MGYEARISRRYFANIGLAALVSNLFLLKTAHRASAIDADELEEKQSTITQKAKQKIIPTRFQAPPVFSTGDTTKPYVYFTFDDCINPQAVIRAVDVARDFGVHLTFFPAGAYIAEPSKWKPIIERGQTEGHRFENHTFSHPYLTSLSPQAIVDQILRQQAVLKGYLGSSFQEHFLRPPYGAGFLGNDKSGVQRILPVVQQNGLKVVMWSVDSKGYSFGNRLDSIAISSVVANVNQAIRPGAIVLQHANGMVDALALPQILDNALKKGYKPISLREGII